MMRLNGTYRTKNRIGWVVVVALFAVLPVCAADGDKDGLEEVRYELIKNGKELLRFDKKTGKLERMEPNDDGTISWVAIPVRETKAIASKPKTDIKPLTPPEESASQARPIEPKKKSAAPVLIDADDKVLEDLITDYDRRTSAATITSYEKSLSVCHSVQIGDRIAGTILMRNKGDKKLKALELTMYVPVVGREKPEEHRFLFVDKPGSASLPPVPAVGGIEPEALTQKVDIPCPAGHARGSADLKITYLKFAE